MTTIKKSFTKQAPSKKWLYGSIAIAALTLGACADNDPSLSEPEAMENVDDAQTPVEQQATDVASANEADNEMEPTTGEVASLDGGTTSEDVDMADTMETETLTNEDIGVADSTAVGVDDADIIDGSESEEHVSTY
ncbi:hypothetical protein [uncultured Psychrobacter sp.]|uniref:hypothetical protein n=1 Tax=uncultured Psychrobacter sp. TaxID=259303 RepID=UPI003459EBAE